MENLPIDPSLLELNHVLKEADDLYRSATRRLGVPECTLWVLYSLRAWPGPITQTQLCQLIHQPKQTINSALKQLEREGQIRLSRGPGRKKYLQLTEAGQELAGRAIRPALEVERQAFLGLPEEERASLLALEQRYLTLLRREANKLFNISQEE